MTTRINRSLIVIIVGTVFLLVGFVMPTFSMAAIGGLQISKTVAHNFEANRIGSNYHYYALMDGDIPYAVVGLKNGFQIHNNLWKEIDPNSAQFSHVVDLVQFFPENKSVTYGAYVLDSNGKRIGTWYSSLNAGVTVNRRTKTVSFATEYPWLRD